MRQIILEAEEDPSIVWFGLFADLLFVAIVVRFADQVNELTPPKNVFFLHVRFSLLNLYLFKL